MDDVLDRVCVLHLHRNVHRHPAVVVPVLLRDQGDPRAVAAVAGHAGQFDAVPKVRPPDADAPGAGGFIALFND